jgi:hypothetical protein
VSCCDSPLARLAELERARRALQAAHNIRKRGRTRGGKIRDAMQHAGASHAKIKSPGSDRGLNIHVGRNPNDELRANYTTPDSSNHPPCL